MRGFLLRSKYLYFIRSSSPPSDSFSIVNGGTSDLFNISIFSTEISISPVGILLLGACLSITFPFTEITNSLPNDLAIEITSGDVFSESIKTCVIPYLSLKSIQIKKPLFLILCTHPQIIIFELISLFLNSPQL